MAHIGSREVRSFLLGWSCRVWQELFQADQRTASPFLLGERPVMLSHSLSARSVSTEQWRHRSSTMSCLDVMYPAYGHYAPYAPTAPAFINSLQVGSEQMSTCVGDIPLFCVIGEMRIAEVRSNFSARLFGSCVKANNLMEKFLSLYLFMPSTC